MTRIPDKKSFQELSNKGLVGNQFRSWATAEEAVAANPDGWFYIRGPVPLWKYMMPWVHGKDLLKTVASIERRSKEPRAGYRFTEVLPKGTERLFNAEIYYGPKGLYVYYVERPSASQSLRESIHKEGRHAHALQAAELLRKNLPPEDADMVRELLKDYEGAVIELTVFAAACGQQNRQTIIWEVRHY